MSYPTPKMVLPVSGFCDQSVWSPLWKEASSDFELLLLVLSCHADVGLRLSWLPVDLQAAKHNDQRWLTVTLTYIKWFCRFSDLSYCCNCCVSQLRGWHHGWLSHRRAPAAVLGQAARVAGAQTLPSPSRSFSLPSGKTTKGSFPWPYLTFQHWSFSPGMLCISYINRFWLKALVSHHV